jgi:hypothetical protein
MSITLTHDAGGDFLAPAEDAKPEAPVAETTKAETPVGYRWVTKRWRVLPDGTRDYAAYHGKTAFSFLLPVGSKVRSPKT